MRFNIPIVQLIKQFIKQLHSFRFFLCIFKLKKKKIVTLCKCQDSSLGSDRTDDKA